MDQIEQGIDAARTRGIDDGKILDSLTQGDQGELYAEGIKKAREKGIEDSKILDSIAQGRQNMRDQAIHDQSWADYAGDIAKAAVRGVGQQISNIGSTLQAPADAPAADQLGAVNKVSGGLMDAGGALQRMAPDSDTGGAQLMSPSTWPKAVAGALPSIAGYLAAARAGAAVGGAAGMLGGPLAEVTSPAGALIGGLGGMGLYAYGQNRGQNATAHANERGMQYPESQDFDKTLNPTLLQSGVDAGLQAAGGMVGKVAGNALGAGADKLIRGAVGDGVPGKVVGAVLNGPNPISGVGLPGVLNTGARVLTTDAALAGQGAADSAIGDYAATKDNAGGPAISVNKALEAAKEQAILGTALRGGRAVGSIHAAAKFGGGDTEALDRVADHLKSDAFPADPTDASKTAETLGLAKSYFTDRVNKLTDIGSTADSIDPNDPSKPTPGLNGREQEAVDTAMLFAKKGAVLDKDALDKLKTTLVADSDGNSRSREGELPGARNQLFQAIRDLNAVNFMAEKAGEADHKPAVSLGAVMRAAKHPVSLGALGELGAEAALHGSLGLGSLIPAAGVGAGAYIGAKALGHLTGISDNNNRPLARMMDRFGTRQGQPMAAVTPISDWHKAVELANRARKAQGAPQAAPEAPQAPHPAAPVMPALQAAPQAPHADLMSALGIQPGMTAPRVTSRPAVSDPAQLSGAVPVGDVNAQSAAAAPDMHGQIAAQARAEGQPLLDVYGQHLRSAHSIRTNPNLPGAIRARAAMEALELKSRMDELEAQASQEEVARARSPKQQDVGPAPGYEPVIDPRGLTPAGQTYMRGASPGFRQALAQATNPGQIQAATQAFLSGFTHPGDAAAAAGKLQSSGVHKAHTARSHARAAHAGKSHGKTGRPRGRPRKH